MERLFQSTEKRVMFEKIDRANNRVEGVRDNKVGEAGTLAR